MAGWGRDLRFVMTAAGGGAGDCGGGGGVDRDWDCGERDDFCDGEPVCVAGGAGGRSGDAGELASRRMTGTGAATLSPWPVYEDLRDQAQSFSGVAAFDELIPASINGKGDPERVWGQATTTNYFDVAQIWDDGGTRVSRRTKTTRK